MKLAGSFGLRACQNPRPGGVPDHFAIGALVGKVCSRISGMVRNFSKVEIPLHELNFMVRDKVGYFLQKTRVTLSEPDPCTKEIHLNVVFPTKDSIYHLFTDLVSSHGTAVRRIRYWRLLATSGDFWRPTGSENTQSGNSQSANYAIT